MFEFNTIEEALNDLREGKLILVTDDEGRENEGDFICAAQYATTETLILWRCTEKALYVCRCPRNI